MKKKLKLFIIGLLLFVFVPCVNAESISEVYVGKNKIDLGTVNESMYGGKVSLSGNATDQILTIEDVNVTDYYKYVGIRGENVTSSIFAHDTNLVVVIKGNNILDNNSKNVSVISYGIDVEYDTLKIIGDGTVDINLLDKNEMYVLCAREVIIGEENTNGPTININYNSNIDGNNGVGIYNLKSISNSNVNITSECFSTSIITIPSDDDAYIKNSNININGIAYYETAVFLEGQHLSISKSDISIDFEIVVKSGYEDEEDDMMVIAFDGQKNVNFYNSKVYIDAKYLAVDDELVIGLNRSKNYDIEYTFIGDKNNVFNINGIDNKYIYVSKESLKNVNTTNYTGNLNTYKYVYISNKEYGVASGNNQNLTLNSITSYNVLLNDESRYFEKVLLDSTELNATDYNYEEGNLTFTSDGIKKLNSLSLGSHKIYVEYLQGKKITIDLTIVNPVNKSSKVVIDTSLNGTIIGKDLFNSIKENNQTLEIDYNGSKITFEGSKITNSKDVNLTIDVRNVITDENVTKLINNGLLVTFPSNGVLPGEAKVSLLLDDDLKDIVKKGTIYLYYVNEETNKLKFESDTAVKVDDNHIEFNITHNSRFVLSNLVLDEDGNVVQENINQSDTLDNVKKHLLLGSISILSITGCAYLITKKH